MSDLFDKFDSMFDSEQLAQDVNEINENGDHNEPREIPDDSYIVTVEKLELAETKAGKPKLSAWLRIATGEFERQIIFVNQVLTAAFCIKKANEFLRGLDTGVEVTFKNFKQYGEMIAAIHELCGDHKFNVNVQTNDKGFKEFKIAPYAMDDD